MYQFIQIAFFNFNSIPVSPNGKSRKIRSHSRVDATSLSFYEVVIQKLYNKGDIAVDIFHLWYYFIRNRKKLTYCNRAEIRLRIILCSFKIVGLM